MTGGANRNGGEGASRFLYPQVSFGN